VEDEKLLDDIADAAREAGAAILQIVRKGFDIEHKGDSSPVTQADHAAELIILAALARAAPGVPVIAEEEVAAGRIPAHAGTFFLVDPLDGTKEFIRGGEDYTVNIALVTGGAPRLGVVYAPATNRLHGGIAGRQAWLDEGSGRQPIACRACARPPVVVASKSHFTQNTSDYLALAAPGCGYAAIGSSLKFCIVAEGRADLYPRLSPTAEWDTAAGHAAPAAGSTGPTARLCAMASRPFSTAPSSPPAAGRRRHARTSWKISPAAASCRKGPDDSLLQVLRKGV
jgi:3'(2'), 5'-bisphosphate nucleotidase